MVLSSRVASPNELARELREPIGNVAYHVRCLVELGAIEMVDTKPVRGATEHFYRAMERPMLTDAEMETLTPEERQGNFGLSLQVITADAGRALAAGTWGTRADSCAVRIPGFVDEEGWAQLRDVYAETYERIFDVLTECMDRVSKEPTTELTSITAGLLCFETPES